MAGHEEESERLQRERLEAGRQAEAAGRRRIVIGYVAAGAIGAAILVAVVFAFAGGGTESGTAGTLAGNACAEVNTNFGGEIPKGIGCDNRTGPAPPAVETTDLTAAAEAAGCELRLDLDDEGSAHLDPHRDELPEYGTNPPTSGAHYPTPLADGAFRSTPSPGNSVHALEHGRVEIEYGSDLPEADQVALKGLLDADRPGMIMFPNNDMPYAVAVTAWRQLMGCESFAGTATLDAVQDFRDAYRGHGPEPIPF